MRFSSSRTIWLAMLPLFLNLARAGEGTLSGYAGGEFRLFPEEAKRTRQVDHVQPALILSPEFRYRGGADRFSFSPYLRLDGRGDDRLHFDIREAYWLHRGEGWDVTAGINRVFWGVTESLHLVDVINQSDFVEDIDQEDKLGQPMVNANFQRSWGTIGLFVLPGFRERSFAGSGGRPAPPLPVDTENAVYESSAGRKHVDLAVRYSHFLGNWDVGASYFRGTGREPRLVPTEDGRRLTPHYDLIDQAGLDVQYTREAWLFKLESLVRAGQGKTFAALVGGVEYTLYQILAGRTDLGLLFEYQLDGRDEEAPATLSDDDLFLGARLAWNDSQDTSLLVGAIIDRNNGSTLLSIEAERRLAANLKMEVEGRIMANTSSGDPLDALASDSFLTLRLSRYF